MAKYLDNEFDKIANDIIEGIQRYPKRDQKAVNNWLQQISCEETVEAKSDRNDVARHVRRIIQNGERVPAKIIEFAHSGRVHYRRHDPEPCASKGPCPRKDIIAELLPRTDMGGIQNVVFLVENGNIRTAAEFIFSISPYVKDRGITLRRIFEKELNLFRELVDDTVDRRIQDEADVMMNTQNDIKQKFRSLSDSMVQRTMRIRQRLFEISETFDWAKDGKDRNKLSRLIKVKRKEMKTDPYPIDDMLHQVFMRGQWLKKELGRLQDENSNLKMYLDKFQLLAAERKAQEMHVPRILCQEKKILEKELNHYSHAYKANLEIIDSLYIEHQRCTKHLLG